MACAVMLISACSASQNNETAKLLFSSGFEDGVYIDQNFDPDSADYRAIRGEDHSTGFSWPISVLGATESALHFIADDQRRAVNAEIQTVGGHDGKPTRALFQQENREQSGDTQAPYEILNITEGRRDLYIKFRIKLDSSSLTRADQNLWRTFFEYKTKGYANGDGYRLIAFIYNQDDGIPYWHWQGDADPQNPLWEIDNKNVPVPMDEWFTTEFYWRWSEGADGRSLWKVNGQVIGDHHGPTTRNSQPLDFILLAQIYGNANPKYQWVDDIEIWDGLPQ